jgi:hypothetical protein
MLFSDILLGVECLLTTATITTPRHNEDDDDDNNNDSNNIFRSGQDRSRQYFRM